MGGLFGLDGLFNELDNVGFYVLEGLGESFKESALVVLHGVIGV